MLWGVRGVWERASVVPAWKDIPELLGVKIQMVKENKKKRKKKRKYMFLDQKAPERRFG